MCRTMLYRVEMCCIVLCNIALVNHPSISSPSPLQANSSPSQLISKSSLAHQLRPDFKTQISISEIPISSRPNQMRVSTPSSNSLVRETPSNGICGG